MNWRMGRELVEPGFVSSTAKNEQNLASPQTQSFNSTSLISYFLNRTICECVAT